jgi:hypothetical protein
MVSKFYEEVTLQGIRIGELLVEQGILSQKQVDHILRVQQASHRPFGDLAERLYDISARAIEDAWVEQYVRVAGIVDLNDVRIDINCLRLLNRRQAWQFQLLPCNKDGTELNLATSAESLVRTVNFSTRTFNEPVYLLMADRQQLLDFLKQHYPVPEHIQQYASKMAG